MPEITKEELALIREQIEETWVHSDDFGSECDSCGEAARVTTENGKWVYKCRHEPTCIYIASLAIIDRLTNNPEESGK